MKEEARNKLLVELSNAPDRQLDSSMTEYLKGLIGKTDEEVKEGLKYVLDQSANGALASDFIMTVLHTLWISLGGQLEPSKPVEIEQIVIVELSPEEFVNAISSLLEDGKEQQALVDIYGFFGRHIMLQKLEEVENVLSDPRILRWSTTILLGVIIATKHLKGKSEARQVIFEVAYKRLGDRAELVLKNLR